MHNVYSYPAGSGSWVGVTVVDVAWMGTLDTQVFKAVNGDDGGTWAPGSPIIFGGSGLQVSGAFSATNVTGLTLPNGCLVDAQSGAEIRLDNGALLLGLAGSQFQMAGTVEITGAGALQLDGSINPTYATPRTVYKQGVELLTVTYAGVAGYGVTWPPGAPDAITSQSTLQAGPLVVTKNIVAPATERFTLGIPFVKGMAGATLQEIDIGTRGIFGTFPTTIATYQALRRAPGYPGTTQSMQTSGAVADAHVNPNWTTTALTSLIVDQNNVIDPGSYDYCIDCTFPGTNPSGAQMVVYQVTAKYSVPNIQR